VEQQRESGVQVGIIPEHVLDVIGQPAEFAEDFLIGREGDESAIIEGRFLDRRILFRHAARKLDDLGLIFANGLDVEIGGEGVDGFDTNAVEADRFLECFGIVLGAGIDLGGAVHDFAQRDAAAVIAHAHRRVVERDFDGLAIAHDKLVNRVVDDLLEEDVNAIVMGAAVAQFADVHAWPLPDVLLPIQRADMLFRIIRYHSIKSLLGRRFHPARPV